MMTQHRLRLVLLIWLMLTAAAGASLVLAEHWAAPPILRLTDPAGDAGPTLNTTASGFAFTPRPSAVPDLAFVDGAGRRHSLTEFRGRPIILNIWATWCEPCRREMSTLDHLQVELAGTDALVVPLSIDHQGPVVVRAFYDKLGIKSLGVYVDPGNAVSQSLGVVGLPTTLLIDRNGGEVARRIGAAAWDSPEILALIRKRIVSLKPARS